MALVGRDGLYLEGAKKRAVTESYREEAISEEEGITLEKLQDRN